MFDFIRNNKKFLMGFLMLLIVPSFVFFGIQGYQDMNEKGEVVAKVGKHDITREAWERQHRSELEKVMARSPGLDRSLLDGEGPRLATLENMVDERVLAETAQKQHIAITDQRLAEQLAQDPNIATLRDAEGKLDVKRYQELLAMQGMTPEMFENNVRAEMARRQVLMGVARSGFVTDSLASTTLRALLERREIQFALFQPRDFRANVQVSDDDIQKYYDEHRASFKTAEQVDAEYVVLDLDAVARTVKLNEADLRAYYEQNNATLAQQEQRRASHILLNVKPGAAAEEKTKVKADAQALLAELRKSPARFAELAKSRSQDPGSAANGGDLDFFARGSMVKPFEDAAFALEKGQISDVVESEFGYHIILLTDIRRPTPPSFEAARPKLEADLKRQQAQRQFAEAAEVFSNTVYEQADSLAPVAEKQGLTVHKVEGLLRSGSADKDETLSNPRLLQALFAEDSLNQKRNIAAVELGPNRLASARVVAYRPAKERPLDEVKQAVREVLVQQRALELAKAEGKAKLEAWPKSPDSAKLAAPVVVARNQLQGLPVPLLKAALSVPASANVAAWTGADLGKDGYAVVRVNRVLERAEPSAAEAEQERAQMSQMQAKAETLAYKNYLRKYLKAEVRVKKSEDSAAEAKN
ncbi:MAG TPA: SurA N-terminal domain-containing protein [Macromonas sp.]|nr:SurA N-terminal domain-containing protein [Macromonas sp.]